MEIKKSKACRETNNKSVTLKLEIMKKAVIGLMMLGMASLAYSQSTNVKIEEVKLSGVEVSPRNEAYIDKVWEGTVAPRVIALEKLASRYNIKESPFYDGESTRFSVKFSEKNGFISAVYDRDGKIVSTHENFKNVALPKAVRNSAYLEYPDWTFEGNAYSVFYDHRKGAKKLYKVQLRKDRIKKNLKYDIVGNKM